MTTTTPLDLANTDLSNLTSTGTGALGGYEYYFVYGQIARSSTNSSYKCIGGATVKVSKNSALVEIVYEYKVVTAVNDGSDFTHGLCVDLLRGLNSNIPQMTTLTGGHINIYKGDSGSIDTSLQGFCGTNITVQAYWVPARIFEYSTNAYGPGQWPVSQFTANSRVAGIAYGVRQ